MSFNPSIHTATNKPVGLTGKPLDARTYYYDAVNFVYRPYLNTAEVLAYLDTAIKRTGHFSVIVNTGGTNFEYWFKDGVADSDLVGKSGGSSSFSGLTGDPMDNAALADDLTRIEGKADVAQDDIDAHELRTDNPHNVTKSQVGLGNVDNTSDVNKPVSTAQAAADAVVLSSAESYADGLLIGLWDDRGNFSASGGAYPSTGGSGTGGAILKGDIWTISVAGTLPTGQVVEVGDVVRALVDTPGNTQANWAILQNNIGYVAENSANKDTDGTLTANSDIKYPSQKATKTYVDNAVADSLLTKASISDLNTGTDDVKYATAAGLEGSNYLKIDDGKQIFNASSGSDDKYAATNAFGKPLSDYKDGALITVIFANTNVLSGVPDYATLNVNGLGEIPLTALDAFTGFNHIFANEIIPQKAYQILIREYLPDTFRGEFVTSLDRVLSFDAENSTDDTHFITPKSLANSSVLTVAKPYLSFNEVGYGVDPGLPNEYAIYNSFSSGQAGLWYHPNIVIDVTFKSVNTADDPTLVVQTGLPIPLYKNSELEQVKAGDIKPGTYRIIYKSDLFDPETPAYACFLSDINDGGNYALYPFELQNSPDTTANTNNYVFNLPGFTPATNVIYNFTFDATNNFFGDDTLDIPVIVINGVNQGNFLGITKSGEIDTTVPYLVYWDGTNFVWIDTPVAIPNQKYNLVIGVNTDTPAGELAGMDNFTDFFIADNPDIAINMWQQVGLFIYINVTGFSYLSASAFIGNTEITYFLDLWGQIKGSDTAVLKNATNLLEINAPGLISVGEDFINGCSSAEIAYLPSAKFFGGGGAFAGCTNLTSLTVLATGTDVQDFEDFYGRKANILGNLSSVNLARVKTVNIGTSGSTFQDDDFINATSIEMIVSAGTITQAPITLNPVTGVITFTVSSGDVLTVFYK